MDAREGRDRASRQADVMSRGNGGYVIDQRCSFSSSGSTCILEATLLMVSMKSELHRREPVLENISDRLSSSLLIDPDKTDQLLLFYTNHELCTLS